MLKKMKSKANEIDILVAKNIKNRRAQLGITQRELATVLDVSVQQIQKYELAINRISSGNLYYLSKALKAPLSYFFGLDSEQELENPTLELWVNGKKISIVEGGNLDIKIKGMQLI